MTATSALAEIARRMAYMHVFVSRPRPVSKTVGAVMPQRLAATIAGTDASA